ncbi:peptidylprolyl isomerase [Shouchella miscanthi]|uniref:peptidylprolyl isomerase n=1 Tax=Shouchella miscanthi TaxID=2598861 RepID=A0ABU6NQ92_9BACI|nr:peptidylprolyl isomerase [Shouchella miscanthi]MED4130177.1 peptidylprolyl isomerase [Shouchella miscanthi]
MKSIPISIVSTILLIGCINADGKNLLEDDIVASTEYGAISKDQFLDELSSRYGNEVITELILENILSNKFEITEKEIDDKITEITNVFSADIDEVLEIKQYDSLTDFEEFIRFNMLLEKAAKESFVVDEEELLNYYESLDDEIRVSTIFVENYSTAEELVEYIKDGQDFGKLAEDYSLDMTAENKGDLGWINRGETDKEFEDVAYELKVGETSGIVNSIDGYHIIKLTEKRGKEPLNVIREELTEHLFIQTLENEGFYPLVAKSLNREEITLFEDSLEFELHKYINSDE